MVLPIGIYSIFETIIENRWKNDKIITKQTWIKVVFWIKIILYGQKIIECQQGVYKFTFLCYNIGADVDGL